VSLDGKFFTRHRRRLRVQGVTYGPFTPNPAGEPFPEPARAREDFADMRTAGVNAIRTYHLTPEWLLGLADQCGLAVFVDAPWPKHLCFLDSTRRQAEARRLVRRAAQRGRGHPCALGYSVGNEVPPDIVRWHGAR